MNVMVPSDTPKVLAMSGPKTLRAAPSNSSKASMAARVPNVNIPPRRRPSRDSVPLSPHRARRHSRRARRAWRLVPRLPGLPRLREWQSSVRWRRSDSNCQASRSPRPPKMHSTLGKTKFRLSVTIVEMLRTIHRLPIRWSPCFVTLWSPLRLGGFKCSSGF